MSQETEDAKTVVDGNEHHVFSAPLLTVELWFRAKTFAIATTMNPKSHWKFLAGIARSLCPYVQVQAVLWEGSLLAITPLRVVTTRVLNGLIAWTTEGVTNLHALPRLNRLWCLPTVLPDWRSSIRNSTIDEHLWMIVSLHTLHLTTFDGQHWIVLCLASCTCKQ